MGLTDSIYAQFDYSPLCPRLNVKRGEYAQVSPRFKMAGNSGALQFGMPGVKLYIDGRDSGVVSNNIGNIRFDTSDLSLGPHVLTMSFGEPNILTYARAVLTVTKPDEVLGGAGVTFRLIGAKKHEGQSGYGPATEYGNWIETVRYPLESGETSVYNVFSWALNNAGLEFREPASNYISGIKAPEVLGGYWLSERDNGVNSGWMYTVNGIHVGQGLRAQKVMPGDEIVWHYVDDHTKETVIGADASADLPYPGGWLKAEDKDPNDTGGGTGEGGVKKGAVQSIINIAENLKESDYTPGSWLGFAEALERAKEIFAKDDATQAELDAVYIALADAIDALVRNTAVTEPKNPDGKGDNDKDKGTVGENKTSEAPVEMNKIQEAKKPVVPGAGGKLPGLVVFDDGAKADVDWSSADSKVVQVDKNGNYKAVGEGRVTLTATAKDGSGKKQSITIIVAKNVTKIRTPLKKIYLKKGASLTPPVRADSVSITGKADTVAKLSYKSSNSKIATVSSSGKIKAKKKGKATITATSLNGKTLKINVVVVKKAKSLKKFTLSGVKNLTVKAGKTAQLKIKLSPAGATNLKVRFKSSNKRVLTVDKAGRLTALKKGKAKITVYVGKKRTVRIIRIK